MGKFISTHFKFYLKKNVLLFPLENEMNSGFITFFNLRQTFESVRSVYCVATNIEYLSWETFCHSTGMVAPFVSFWSF